MIRSLTLVRRPLGFFLLLGVLGLGACSSGSDEEAASDDASLAALSLLRCEPGFEFHPDQDFYAVPVGFLLTSVQVLATAADPGATITVGGEPVPSGAAAAPIPLEQGANVLEVQVTAADGVTQQTYTLLLNRQIAALFAHDTYYKASNTGTYDAFGTAIALDCDTLVVGAPFEDSGAQGIGGNQFNNDATDSGAVYVFTRANDVWTQEAYIKASNAGTTDQFGAGLALWGDTLVVGAPQERSGASEINGDQDDDTAPAAGAVYVFTRSSGTWNQEAYIKASNAQASDLFGSNVALWGDTLAVGALGEASIATGIDGDQNDNSGAKVGAVYVFTREQGTWSQEAYIKPSSNPFVPAEGGSAQLGDVGIFFGIVALYGDTLAVGALGESSDATGIDGDQADSSKPFSGAVYVFERDQGVWSQQAYVKASNTDAGDLFGVSVALDADRLAVGAIGEASNALGIDDNQLDNSAALSGAVYLFTRTGGTWSQDAYLKASNTGVGDRFGISVALRGELLAVGAEEEDSNAVGVDGVQLDDSSEESGAVYLFERVAGAWSQAAYIKASNTLPAFQSAPFALGDPLAGARFGSSLALFDDGLAICARREASGDQGVNANQQSISAPDSGAVYLLR